jgi:multidrug resistance efflux pump
MLEEKDINTYENQNAENLIELRSEEVQEILGTPPSWMVRWGTTLAALVLLILLFVAWFVKYPEIKEARLVLTTSVPPSPLVTRVASNIEKIFVEENDVVKQGQLLVVLSSPAKFEDVLMLEEELKTLKQLDETNIKAYEPDRTLVLGDLQKEYANLLVKFGNYTVGDNNNFLETTVSLLQQEKNNILASIKNDQLSLADANLELDNALIDQNRVKQLFVSKIKSLHDLEKAQNQVLQVKGRIKKIESDVLEKRSALIAKDEAINRARNEKTEQSGFNFVELREEVQRLQGYVDGWKQSYLITSPVDGLVAFNGLVKENQFVESGKTLLRIIPEKDKEWIGRVELPTLGSGKVEVGQRVVVKFDNYPFEEYGVVEGIVRRKSVLPSGDRYNLEVEFPKGLQTSYKKQDIPYKPEMEGRVEIITDNKRFLTWVFDKLISRFKSY